MRAVVVVFLLAAGCVVGDTGTGTGSGDSTGSGSGSGSANNTMPDAGTAGVACTGAVYDPCTDPAQCMSGKCQPFSQSGFQVCTQTCTPGDNTTCPQQNGQPATCNGMGICKPATANTCTR